MENKDKKLIHDLKNKLLVIEHHFEQLKTGDKPQSETAIDTSLSRCFELISDYISDSHEVSKLEVFSLEDIISKSAIPQYEQLEKMYNLKILVNYDLELDGIKVKGNEPEFKKVRENIVENAVNAKASFLKVNAIGHDGYLELIYENDGNQITDELLSQINNYSMSGDFKEFKSIGTKIIKEVCAEHGFTVNYEKSEIGTKITITVPYYIEA